jgi:hypothetical protein
LKELGNTVNNKTVARFTDGHLIKGTTADFLPGRDVFHVIDASAPPEAPPVQVRTAQLKALFFVKDLAGNLKQAEPAAPVTPRPALGRRMRVVFNGGEVLVGTTTGYNPDRQGFFLEPEDVSLNEERCYVLTAATKEVRFL